MDGHTKCVMNSMLVGAAVSSLVDVSDDLMHGTFKGNHKYESIGKMVNCVTLIDGARNNMTQECRTTPPSRDEAEIIANLQAALNTLIDKNKFPTKHELKTINEAAQGLRVLIFNSVAGKEVEPAVEIKTVAVPA